LYFLCPYTKKGVICWHIRCTIAALFYGAAPELAEMFFMHCTSARPKEFEINYLQFQQKRTEVGVTAITIGTNTDCARALKTAQPRLGARI